MRVDYDSEVGVLHFITDRAQHKLLKALLCSMTLASWLKLLLRTAKT